MFVCMALSIAGLALVYSRYAECELNVMFISITLLSVIILTALSGTLLSVLLSKVPAL